MRRVLATLLESRRPTTPLEDRQAFERESVSFSLAADRTALLLALFLYIAFAALDYRMAPAARGEIWLLRGVVCVILAGALLALRRPLSPARVQALLSLIVLVIGAAMTGMVLLSARSGGRDYSAALVPVILFAYGLVRLRFVLAAATSWTVTLVWAAVALRVYGAHGPLLANAFILVSAAKRACRPSSPMPPSALPCKIQPAGWYASTVTWPS
jgi:hypothetical protein